MRIGEAEEKISEKKPGKSKDKTWIWITVTVVYIGFFVWFAVKEDVTTLKLNEIGDFLAGVFGPVAILWLILGYLQQGRELKNSTEALTQQYEEFRKSSEQQSKMAEVMIKQYILEQSKLKPKFVAKSGGSTWSSGHGGDKYRNFTLLLENVGNVATDIDVYIQNADGESLGERHFKSFKLNELEQLQFVYDWNGSKDFLSVIVRYLDKEGNRDRVIFELIPSSMGETGVSDFTVEKQSEGDEPPVSDQGFVEL